MNRAFEKNIKYLQEIIDVLSDDTGNRELLRSAISEYRQWIKMYVDYKNILDREPIGREEMITKFFKICIQNKIRNKEITILKKQLRKYEEMWDKIGT